MQIKDHKLPESKDFGFINIGKEHDEKLFKAHRHTFFEIIIITKGKGKHAIDFQEYELKKDIIYLMKPSQIHQWKQEHFNNEYDGYILYFSEELFSDSLLLNKLFNENFNHILYIKESIRSDIFNLIKILEKANKKNDSTLIYHLVSSILKLILEVKEYTHKKNNLDLRIFLLEELVEKNFKEEKNASFYANQLNISRKRLNELTKENLNKTITEIISNRIILEAKRELTFGQNSIIKISDNLGFLNSSYFSKFFKKHVHISPLYYKKEKNL